MKVAFVLILIWNKSIDIHCLCFVMCMYLEVEACFRGHLSVCGRVGLCWSMTGVALCVSAT